MAFLTACESKHTALAPVAACTSTETTEQELVAEAQAGSTIAFERLIEKYERRIFRLGQNITRNREDAEDAMQNALVKAFRKLPTFRGDSSFYTWLVRITVNEALMGIRRRRWKEVSMIDSDESDGPLRRDEIEDWGPNPEQRYSETELQDILAKAIRALGPGYRIVFQLRDIESFSTRETAQALSLSPTAVKTRLRRARLQLRRSLNKYFGSAGHKNTANLAVRDRANADMGRSAGEN
jgi:RNA polymerase sigma-70 factor, ECF subfamily